MWLLDSKSLNKTNGNATKCFGFCYMLVCTIEMFPSCLHYALIKPLLSSHISAAPASGAVAPAISLTDNALSHLNKMRSERSQDLCLRIGVKQGGCSGMSYTMDFEDKANTRPDDSIIEYQGFVIGMTSYSFSHH